MTKTEQSKGTTNALEILDRRIPTTPDMERLIELERVNTEVGQRIYELRKKMGLTQKQLADKVGTTQSVISELEDADYGGNSVAMLTNIAQALGGHLKIDVVMKRRRKLQPA